jgi:hypothetical protein
VSRQEARTEWFRQYRATPEGREAVKAAKRRYAAKHPEKIHASQNAYSAAVRAENGTRLERKRTNDHQAAVRRKERRRPEIEARQAARKAATLERQEARIAARQEARIAARQAAIRIETCPACGIAFQARDVQTYCSQRCKRAFSKSRLALLPAGTALRDVPEAIPVLSAYRALNKELYRVYH